MFSYKWFNSVFSTFSTECVQDPSYTNSFKVARSTSSTQTVQPHVKIFMRRFSTICNCVNVLNVEKLLRATLSCHNSLTIYAMRKNFIAFDLSEKILSFDVFNTLQVLYTLYVK